MNHKTLLLGTVLIGVISYSAYYFMNPASPLTEEVVTVDASTAEGQVFELKQNEDGETKLEAQVETKDNSVDTAVVSEEVLSTGYTIEEVASHNTEDDCWTAVNGFVYDLTPFITKHPGGKANIMRICGIDGTKAFEGKHGGDEKPENTLAGLEIGVLK